MTSSLTCITCHALFKDAEEQRSHYRSDWHRFNLNRKVQDLPPLTEPSYQERMEMQGKDESARKGREKSMVRYGCDVCKRTFSSEKALLSHHKSSKHAREGQDPNSYTVVGGKEGNVEFFEGSCFLCSQVNDSTETLMDHLASEHHFYLPDAPSVANLPGLIGYLQEKVLVWHACLSCHDDRRFVALEDEEEAAKTLFQSAHACMKHMQDKGHAKVRFDDVGENELAPFYSYGKKIKMHVAGEEVIISKADSEFEDITDGEDDADGDGPTAWIAPDETEMILPSGVRVGNRAYRRYYKQNLIPYNGSGEENAFDYRSAPMRSIMAKKQDSNDAVAAVVGFRQGRHTLAMARSYYSSPLYANDRQARMDQRSERTAQVRSALDIGVRANWLQKHFRDQLLQ